MPMVTTKPKLLVKNGVNAVPTASSSTPPINTGVKPKRSAHAPATGCAKPHMNCPTAMAKLIATMLTPVEPLMGKTKQPLRLPRPHGDHQHRRRGEGDVAPGVFVFFKHRQYDPVFDRGSVSYWSFASSVE